MNSREMKHALNASSINHDLMFVFKNASESARAVLYILDFPMFMFLITPSGKHNAEILEVILTHFELSVA